MSYRWSDSSSVSSSSSVSISYSSPRIQPTLLGGDRSKVPVPTTATLGVHEVENKSDQSGEKILTRVGMGWQGIISAQLANALRGIEPRDEDAGDSKEVARFAIPFFRIMEDADLEQMRNTLMKALWVFDRNFKKEDLVRRGTLGMAADLCQHCTNLAGGMRTLFGKPGEDVWSLSTDFNNLVHVQNVGKFQLGALRWRITGVLKKAVSILPGVSLFTHSERKQTHEFLSRAILIFEGAECSFSFKRYSRLQLAGILLTQVDAIRKLLSQQLESGDADSSIYEIISEK